MIAFVMSGGGARGAFQVGALKGFQESGIRPNFVLGTSTGALNALGLSHVGIKGLEEIWLKIKGNSDIIRLNWFKLFLTGFYHTKPLKKLIDQASKEPGKIPVWVCYLNMKNGEILYCGNDVSNTDFAWAVHASSVMPVIMEPVDEFFVDGGLREQSPVEQAILLGASEIYLILTNPVTRDPSSEYSRKFPWFYHDLARATDIMSHEIYLNDMRVCQHKYPNVKLNIIAPDKQTIDVLDFNPVKIRETIQAGYLSSQSFLDARSTD